MNNRLAKKIRKEAEHAALKRDKKILPELKMFINKQTFMDRVKIAWLILWGKF